MGIFNDKFYINNSDLIDVFYPVGTIYETKDPQFNPNITWGGVWTKIEDKFLVGAGTTYTGTGGSASASVTLTTDNLPSHNHTFTGSEHSHSYTPAGSISVAANPSVSVSGGSHRHSATTYKQAAYSGSVSAFLGSNQVYVDSGSSTQYTDYSGSLSMSGSASGGSYTFSGTAATLKATQGGTVGSTGSGTAFSVDTIPPYQAVYIWERTA